MKHEHKRLIKNLELKSQEEKRLGIKLLTDKEREILNDPAQYIFNQKFNVDLHKDKDVELILEIKIREK